MSEVPENGYRKLEDGSFELRICNRCDKWLEINPADEPHCTNCGSPEFRLENV